MAGSSMSMSICTSFDTKACIRIRLVLTRASRGKYSMLSADRIRAT